MLSFGGVTSPRSAPLVAAYRKHVVHRRLHLAALVLAATGLLATILHYRGELVGSPLMWVSWLLAVGAYTASFVRRPVGWPEMPSLRGMATSEPGIAVSVLVLYLVTHLWNFPIAPWNEYGLFDDAAWDIYFAGNHAFSGPFQPAFFDQVGLISRETLFHYYITVFFEIFGYNLLVFIGALLVLGYVTVVFTTLTVHRLFRTTAITVVAAVVLNFLPLHYLHVFVGHRYAIAAPLMMVSLYLLYSGFQDRSAVRISLSGLFAALCLGSAIMGKQFILGLAVAAVLLPIVERRRWASLDTRALALAWTGAFVIAAIPLLVYITFNADDYFRRDQGLLTGFLGLYLEQGYAGIRPFVDQMLEMFFARHTYTRLWLHDFPIVPDAYWSLLLPGLVIALLRRRLEIVFLAGIPVASALLAGAYDFRVLLAAPIWVIAMAFTLDAVSLGRPEATGRPLRVIGGVIVLAIVAVGVVPSATYLWQVSQDTHSRYLFPHRDVAVSRLIQDVVVGSPEPSAEMKPDEFNREVTGSALTHDALACPENAYATAHLYLQQFDAGRILAFCAGGNQRLLGQDGVLAANVRAVVDQGVQQGRGLKLIWEESAIAQPAIDWFGQFEHLGTSQRLDATVDSEPFSIYVLTVAPESVALFREAVAAASPEVAP